jgi:hypothetical protein
MAAAALWADDDKASRSWLSLHGGLHGGDNQGGRGLKPAREQGQVLRLATLEGQLSNPAIAWGSRVTQAWPSD